MKKLFRFALAALATAAMFVSCEDELKPEEKPDDKDQKVELKGISLDKTTATVKVGETATLKVLYNPDNATEKPAAKWTSDTPAVATVADGVVTGVAAGEAKITATVGTFTATATVTVTEDAVPSKYPLGLVDWDNLNKDYLVSLELPEGAAMTGLKSAKLYYDDKLYILAEISDEAVADGKVRMHVYFDVDKTGKLQQHWDKAAIDYMTEGKITNSGAYVSYSSTLYKWDGTPEDPWKWADSGLAPTCVGDGKDNLYEMSMDYAAFADKMPVAFNIGLDVVNSSWATFGFLPSVAEGTPKLARIVKAGQTDPGEEPEDTWDYTPSAEYLAADNLWKDVDAANSVTWYYNPNWAGELPAPETSFKESTWTVKLNEEDTAMEWTTQMKIHPTTDLILDPAKKYTFTAKVYSSTGTHVFFKMYQDGLDWPESFESPAGANRIAVPAGETVEIKVEDFYPLATPQILLIDFAQHGANNTIHVKDITLKVTGEAAAPVEWDYTPSEDYLASNNLWKPVFDDNAEKYYYYHCTSTEWNGADVLDTSVPFLSKTKSTYELNYEAQTGAAWQNQFFIFPDAGREIPLQADKTYKLKVTLGTNVALAPGFFKFSKFDASNAKCEGEAIWEAGSLTLTGAEPTVLEKEISGVECANIIFVMDFGGNPADTKIYIKDISILAPKELVKKAEWQFSEADMCQNEDSYGFTFSSGEKAYKSSGAFDGMKVKADKAAGDGGLYVKSNLTPGGLIQYFQIDKTEIDVNGKAARTVGASGHPYVTGVWPGDYWLFTLGEADGPQYPAGTKLHINFLTRLSGTGQKYWLLEYWDGQAWQAAADVQDGAVGEGDAAQSFKYNFEPTTSSSNSTVDVTWTLAAATSTPMFRYTCMANWQANGNGALEAPNGGTCRIAGAAGTSPVFEVVE